MKCPKCKIEMEKKIDTTVKRAGFGFQCPECEMIGCEGSPYPSPADEDEHLNYIMKKERELPDEEEMERKRLKSSWAQLVKRGIYVDYDFDE